MAEHRADNPEVAAPMNRQGRYVRGSNPAAWTMFRNQVRKHFSLKWGERIYAGENPYLRRWALVFGLASIRVHHFLCSDDDRAFHDHPWWFITFVIKGGYTDVSPSGKDHLGRGSIRFRPALHRHTVQIDPGGVWTVLLTGPNLRTWGFWVNGKFRKSNKYFFEHGHHQCDQ